MSISETGWSNPYTGEYEALISRLEASAKTGLNDINFMIDRGLNAEQTGANSYQALAAPETWSALAINPLNAICQKLNKDFLDTVAYRISQLSGAKITNTAADFKA